MSGMHAVKDIKFTREFVSDLSREEIVSGIKDQFIDFEVVDAQCSKPLPSIGGGRDGFERYELTVVIKTNQLGMAKIALFADSNRWKRA